MRRDPFEVAVAAAFSEHRMDLGGRRVLVAVSGGGDSVALLAALAASAPRLGLELRCATVDHGLRDAVAEHNLAAELCARLCVPWQLLAVQAKRLDGSLQAGARAARIQTLTECSAALGARAIALGHTADDQAETLLLRLVRGAGLVGLGGMAPVRRPFVRPLLGLRRDECREYLVRQGLAWAEDPSNEAPRFLRNRVRHELLPLLESLQPGATQRLAHTAGHLQQAQRALAPLVESAVDRAVIQSAPGALTLDRDSLLAVDAFLLPLVLARAAGRVRGDTSALSRSGRASLFDLVRSAAGGRRIDLGGLQAERRANTVLLHRAPAESAPFPEALEVWGPGCYRYGKSLLIIERIDAGAPRANGRSAADFDAAGVAWPLRVSPPQAGATIVPFGAPGRKRVARILIDKKVPRIERAHLCVVRSGGEVLWVAGVCRGDAARVDAGGDVLRFRLITSRDR